MTSHMLRSIALLASAFLYGAAAHGSVIYNEAISGDLSNSGLTPTQLFVSLGLNDVLGSTGKSAAGVIDRDYFTFTVPQGLELTGITVLSGTQTLGPLGESFIGMESGPELTVNPATATDATGLLGWDHYGLDNIGVNLLPQMGISSMNSIGFSGPLPAGAYSFWVQEASVGSVNYDIEFTVAPEPATWTMLLTGMAAITGAARGAARCGLSRRTATDSNNPG